MRLDCLIYDEPADRLFDSDSGGQYRDGTCDTTRTVHFGRPTDEQIDAFTRVLQGHVRLSVVSAPFATLMVGTIDCH